jgi:hypothetical protein
MLDATLGRPTPFSTTPIRVAVVASLLVHLALMFELPQFRKPLFGPPEFEVKDSPLTVRLVPQFEPPAESAPPPSPARAPQTPAPQVRPRPSPPVLAMEQPPTVPAPKAAPPVSSGDLLAYVDARRLAREQPAESRDASAPSQVENERQRANRLAMANLGEQKQITFGFDPSRSGGVFTIVHQSVDYAEFSFVGWNKDMGRRTKQLIEVRREGNGTIQLAVVRRMIAIIRMYEPVEFSWDSRRLGRTVVLSSRVRDSPGLEDFMLREFF